MRYLRIIIILYIGIITCDTHLIFSEPKIWIEHSDSMFARPMVIKDGIQKKTLNFFFQTTDISDMVKDNENALKFAQRSNDYGKEATYWFYFGYLLGGLGTIIASGPVYEINQNAGLITLGTGVVVAIITALIMNKKVNTSKYFLYKSINTYNGVYKSDVNLSY